MPRTILLISPYWKEDHRWMVSTVKLAELWQRLGATVHVVCMGDTLKYGSTERISDSLTIHRIKDFFLPDPWNYGIAFGFSGRVMQVARSVRPDVIVVNKVLFWSSIALLRLRLSGKKVLLLTDALVGITWWPRGRIARICAALYANTLGWLILLAASKIVFFHPQPERVLQRLCIRGKSQVIPTGIDEEKFSAEERSSSPQINVTYLGRLESVKGADDFVAAALAAKDIRPEIHVRAVGWYRSGHPLVVTYSSRVEFTGLRHDVQNVLRETDIFVLPSYSEGLSNALMEAMASGCACIASDVGGNRFLIQNGISGFLFPAGDRSALTGHIRRLAEDSGKRLQLGKNARQRIQESFSWKNIALQYDQLFSQW